ncbi:hypothetical protein NQ314_008400 [Rhamnusium bicolor]|uniref:Uncharacterized protein n=1 Tax=Rhamnusium bicolor TaxID=1586634 RepID=A0AAV8YC88_9CUCU|nr:hypothetical protein NQ314_008400 [Rhamnusium bicolor]
MFGCKQRIGLADSSLERETYEILETEEDLEKIMEGMAHGTDHEREENVTSAVKVSDIDRGRLALRNVLAVVLSVNESGLHKLGTKEGALERLYSRNEFTFTDSNFMNPSDVLSSSLNLRKTSALSSGSRQGFVMCHFRRYCNTKRCN